MPSRRSIVCLLACLAALSALLLSGCASNPGPQSSDANNPVNAENWIGRWIGASDRDYLQIMPTARADHYQVTLHNGYSHARHFDAWQVDRGLDFQRDDHAATIRAGRGNQSLEPAMAELDDCLLVADEVEGSPPDAYCRRANTADALPLARGSYVQVRSTCWDAAPADLLYFDGIGLAESTQHACRASIAGQQGIIYTLADSCTPALGGQPVTSQVQITVVDDRHFASQPLGGEVTLFEYCPGKPIPTAITTPSP